MRLANRIKHRHRAQTIATSLSLALALCLTPLPAAAVNVTVGGMTYDIGFGNTSYTASTLLLETQPWWGHATLAEFIITQYLLDGGDTFADFGLAGLNFAIEPQATAPTTRIDLRALLFTSGPLFTSATNEAVTNYAIALSVTPAVPAVAAVPEIDGNALAKALFVLFTLGVGLQLRRNRHAA